MEREELLQGIIDDIMAVRHGENRAWIFDENTNVSEDVYVFDTVKLLEEFKYNTDIIVNEVPTDIDEVRKEAEEVKTLLENIDTYQDMLDFLDSTRGYLLDENSIMLNIDGQEFYLDELEDKEIPRDAKITAIGLTGYGNYLEMPKYTRCVDEYFKDAEPLFMFNVLNDDGDVILDDASIDDFEYALKSIYLLNPDDFYEMGKGDNTYNYNCNISNDIAWFEADTDAYGKIAMMKFHIAGDVRGNYTDEIFLKLGEYNSLMEYLYNEYDEVIMEHKAITVDGKDYDVEIDAFRDSVEIYNEDWESISCYDIEKEDIIAKIREEFAPMQSIGNEDVSKDKKTDKGKDNR